MRKHNNRNYEHDNHDRFDYENRDFTQELRELKSEFFKLCIAMPYIIVDLASTLIEDRINNSPVVRHARKINRRRKVF